jgi:hypothetical protein
MIRILSVAIVIIAATANAQVAQSAGPNQVYCDIKKMVAMKRSKDAEARFASATLLRPLKVVGADGCVYIYTYGLCSLQNGIPPKRVLRIPCRAAPQKR